MQCNVNIDKGLEKCLFYLENIRIYVVNVLILSVNFTVVVIFRMSVGVHCPVNMVVVNVVVDVVMLCIIWYLHDVCVKYFDLCGNVAALLQVDPSSQYDGGDNDSSVCNR